jgi:hypothetical protein
MTSSKAGGVNLGEAKNPEGDGTVYEAHILWILHSAWLSLP